MSKKILSIVLALMLVLSTFAVTAFAESATFEVIDEDAGEILSTQTWALGEPVEVSAGVYKVDVSLTTNYVVGAISFRIDSENGAKLTDAVVNEEVIDFTNNVAFKDNGKVLIIPEPAFEAELGAGVADEGEEPGIDGVIATVTFTLAEGTDGDTLTLVNDVKSETNPAGDLVAVRLSDECLSTATFIYGQRVLDADGADLSEGDEIASVTIGEAAAAAPVLNGVDTGYVDTDRKYVYGVPAGEDASAYFTVENGSFEITGTFTGAILTVKDKAGNAVDTYTLIIFGDVNGDGAVTATDFAAVKDAATGGTIAGEANAFAADVNGDGSVTATDFAAVKDAATGGTITVNPYAA